MSISLILEMAVSSHPERLAITDGGAHVTVGELEELSGRGAGLIAAAGVRSVAYVGTGGVMLPALIFSSARAGTSFAPLNYRLSAAALRELVARLPAPLVVVDDEHLDAVAGAGELVMTSSQFVAASRTAESAEVFADPHDVAVVLFTSGTTARPKAVELSHANLTNYVTGTVEFGSATENDAALVCVPPYHVAGVGAALSNLYAGRRIVYLRRFDPHDWVRLVKEERVSTATVVPTMLDRIVAVLDADGAELPTLRNLAYGGAKVGLPLVRKALDLLPGVGFVNAYGLTETSSTIAVLNPDDHRIAHAATEGHVARRLRSVGRATPGVDLQIRGRDGAVLAPGSVGELFVRGPQVSGRYAEIGSVLDGQGWFPTRDLAMLDDDGYLYVIGRSDDTIIRGGENVAPAEIEDVLVEHPDVHEVAVVGVEDPEWGQIIVAVVVPEPNAATEPESLREFVRERLRGSRTPDRIIFRDQLPATVTGKVLRRQLIEELTALRRPSGEKRHEVGQPGVRHAGDRDQSRRQPR